LVNFGIETSDTFVVDFYPYVTATLQRSTHQSLFWVQKPKYILPRKAAAHAGGVGGVADAAIGFF
jgi:hypothetical protein